MRNQTHIKSVAMTQCVNVLFVLLAAISAGCEADVLIRCDESKSVCEVVGREHSGGGSNDGFGTEDFTEDSDLEFGPKTIHFDMGHHNFNTLDNYYFEFAETLRGEGYSIVPVEKVFTPGLLEKMDVLVICNALASEDTEQWLLPNPSAFTRSEIDAVVEWVQDGGSLFLIADHMPFPGAASELALEFGFEFFDGFLTNTDGHGKTVYEKSTGTLLDSPITSTGYDPTTVEKVVAGTGQAFFAPENAIPMLSVPEGFTVRLPQVAWQFDENTIEIPAEGMVQGALLEHKDGRVAVFGEANQIDFPTNI